MASKLTSKSILILSSSTLTYRVEVDRANKEIEHRGSPRLAFLSVQKFFADFRNVRFVRDIDDDSLRVFPLCLPQAVNKESADTGNNVAMTIIVTIFC